MSNSSLDWYLVSFFVEITDCVHVQHLISLYCSVVSLLRLTSFRRMQFTRKRGSVQQERALQKELFCIVVSNIAQKAVLKSQVCLLISVLMQSCNYFASFYAISQYFHELFYLFVIGDSRDNHFMTKCPTIIIHQVKKAKCAENIIVFMREIHCLSLFTITYSSVIKGLESAPAQKSFVDKTDVSVHIM